MKRSFSGLVAGLLPVECTRQRKLTTMSRTEIGYGCSFTSVGKQKRIRCIFDLAPREDRKVPLASET